MEEIEYSEELMKSFEEAKTLAFAMRHEYLTPEHWLRVLLNKTRFQDILERYNIEWDVISDELTEYLMAEEKVPDTVDFYLSLSCQFKEMLDEAASHLLAAEKYEMDIPHVLVRLLALEDSQASYLMLSNLTVSIGDFMSGVIEAFESEDKDINEIADEGIEAETKESSSQQKDGKWRDYVVCINEALEGKNPLIGREKELARTIQVLCRKDKNNPLHVGEPGVGKTALVYGLARLINEGNVPDRLKDARIYGLELGDLLAGTQFRGDFEKRLKMILEGASKNPKTIIYIDEIHNLVGAGAVGESSLDASNMLKPYLEDGKIRFIGSTTFDEYKRYFARSKGLVRRFSKIDIEEPSIEDAINILTQLKSNYETFHGVIYQPEALEYAVTGSARHIHDRFLPDKAIDLIDEAGAFYQSFGDATHKSHIIDKAKIAETLAKICKVESMVIDKAAVASLETLEGRIRAKIYGQDEAVKSVVEAVQMSKAGLSDDEKPLASLLFIGPTGVGKTELARSLAEELGIELVRFDMSEYAEKHTVAKLIGSPAGYVGYEDGGLLTDAIRKNPDCVLLLDEIEKAHPDIYNILLQVMDYGRLTDNKGNKADFRNVILIMTSNAGARYASQANVGFGSAVSTGAAMLNQVKKTFQPEFLNRLSGTVVFNSMDENMASLILNKKLQKLEEKLQAKNVEMTLREDAHDFLLSKGYTREYGAREMDRVISQFIKPLLMKEILFGSLKNGGKVTVGISNEKLILL